MKNPQTLAIKLNEQFPNNKLAAIGKWGCCAFVLMWCLGIEPEDVEAVQTVSSLMSLGALDEECTVYWAKAIMKLTGREMQSLEKVSIKSLRGIKGRTPVLYSYNGKGHWVGVENGKIVFNPLKESLCVKYGKPSEKRVLKIKGVSV